MWSQRPLSSIKNILKLKFVFIEVKYAHNLKAKQDQKAYKQQNSNSLLTPLHVPVVLPFSQDFQPLLVSMGINFTLLRNLLTLLFLLNFNLKFQLIRNYMRNTYIYILI